MPDALATFISMAWLSRLRVVCGSPLGIEVCAAFENNKNPKFYWQPVVKITWKWCRVAAVAVALKQHKSIYNTHDSIFKQHISTFLSFFLLLSTCGFLVLRICVLNVRWIHSASAINCQSPAGAHSEVFICFYLFYSLRSLCLFCVFISFSCFVSFIIIFRFVEPRHAFTFAIKHIK